MKMYYVYVASAVIIVLGTVVLMGFAPDDNGVDEETGGVETVKDNSGESEVFEDLVYGFEDEISERKTDSVKRTKDGIKASIYGPTILKVGETSIYSIELRNETSILRPESPFDFRRESRNLLTSGPITIGKELRGPGSDEVRAYPHNKSGATHTLIDVTCNEAGPATITFSSKGKSDITTPPSPFSLTVDFNLTCVEVYENESLGTRTEEGGIVAIGLEYPDAKQQFVTVYTIDGVPYAQGQFQVGEPEESVSDTVGCPFLHIHSNVDVQPFQQWFVRGNSDMGLQTNVGAVLTDPAPDKCGFGVDSTLGPKSVLVPIPHLIEVCERFDFEWIEPLSELDERGSENLLNLCNTIK